MRKTTPVPVPSRTLTGLSPPEREPGEPGHAHGNVPETLRPWTVPEKTAGASGDGEADIRIPLAPIVPRWLSSSSPRVQGDERPKRERRVALDLGRQVFLVSIALLGAGTFGWALGHGPLQSRARTITRGLEQATSGAVGASASLPSFAEASPPREQSSSAAPEKAGTEPTLEPASPAAKSSGEVPEELRGATDSIGKRRRNDRSPATSSTGPALSLVPDEARIRVVAEAVHLDDEVVSRDAGPDAAR